MFILFCLFFLFDIYEIDSESEKKLIYDTSKLYEEDNYLIYFKDLNSKELDRLKNYNVDILSYLIGDERYYARNSQALIKEYTKDMNMENKILYEINGLFVPSHGEVSNDIHSLIKLNKDKTNEILNKILLICKNNVTLEDIVKNLFDTYGLQMNLTQYYLISSTIKAYLSYLIDEGKIKYEFIDNKMYFKSNCQ